MHRGHVTMTMIMKRRLVRHGREVDRVVGDRLENFIFVNRCVYRKQIDQCCPIKHVKSFCVEFSALKMIVRNAPDHHWYIIHILSRNVANFMYKAYPFQCFECLRIFCGKGLWTRKISREGNVAAVGNHSKLVVRDSYLFAKLKQIIIPSFINLLLLAWYFCSLVNTIQ